MNSEKTSYIPREEDCIGKTNMQYSISGIDFKIQAQMYCNASEEYFLACQVQEIHKSQLTGKSNLEFFDEGLRQISESEAAYYMSKYFDSVVLSWRLRNEIAELKNPRLPKTRAKSSAYCISHRKPSRKRKYIVSRIAGVNI